MKSYNAVILGGGKSPVDPTIGKGNTSFQGGSLAGRVYEIVRASYDFNRIAVVMDPDEKVQLRARDQYVQPAQGKGAWLSGYRGIQTIGPGEYVMIAGDLGLLEQQTVQAFMKILEKTDMRAVLPLVPRDINEQHFPDRKRTYQPFKEGEFVAANMGFIGREVIEKYGSYAEEFSRSYQKKSAFIVKLIITMGLTTVLRSHHKKLPFVHSMPLYEKLFPKFSLREAEERIAEFTGSEVRLIEFPYPDAAFDIDRRSQWVMANEIFEKRLEERVA